MHARSRYDQLSTYRSQFLETAVRCSELTLPYLIQRDETRITHQILKQPWQSVGAKAVVTLAAKLMLSLLPPQTTFFKLQVRDDKLGTDLPAQVRSELDLSFAKMERMVMDSIAASSDRVTVHQALKHLVVGGNALVFMGKDGLKHYPLNRYVVERDGNGNIIEIVTKELINKKLLPKEMVEAVGRQPNTGIDSGDITEMTLRSTPTFVSTTTVGSGIRKSLTRRFLGLNPKHQRKQARGWSFASTLSMVRTTAGDG